MGDDNTMTIANRLRELRRRRGWSQENLAGRADVSLGVIRKIEQGGTARMETYHALARTLGVKTVWFVTAATPEPREQAADDLVLADMRSAINPPIGLTGKPLYGTADGDTADLGRLEEAVSAVAAAYHADRYDALAGIMPALVRSAHHHVDAFNSGDNRTRALRLRADVVGLTGRYLIQIRAHDLALIALHASLKDALEVGDVPLAAAAISSQAWAMLRQGRLDEVEALCATTADEIEPKMSTATPDELSGWGYLLLRAAGAAARNNRMQEAREFTTLAGTAGARLARQHEDLAGHVAFGPLTPALLGPEIELLADQPDKALELAEQVPRDVGRGNTSGWNRHRLDVANAHVRVGNLDAATDILAQVRAEHGPWMRYQQYARDTVRALVDARTRMPNEAQRGLVEFMNIQD